MLSTVSMTPVYDNRILSASGNTAFALDASLWRDHSVDMESEDQIRAALRAKLDAKEITQTDIAAALGVGQPNANTLFNPGKNGKIRAIKFDEAQKLIQAFGLASDPEVQIEPINEELLGRLLHALAPSFPKTEVSASAAKALAAALSHALLLLRETGATDPTDREIAMAARAATSRFGGAAAA